MQTKCTMTTRATLQVIPVHPAPRTDTATDSIQWLSSLGNLIQWKNDMVVDRRQTKTDWELFVLQVTKGPIVGGLWPDVI